MFTLVACEKLVFSEIEGKNSTTTADANIILRFVQYEQEAFSAGSGSAVVKTATRAATDITALWSRLSIALFDADGTFRMYLAGEPWPTGTSAVNFSGGH